MVVSYAREGKLPLMSLSVSDEALRLIITGFEACKQEVELTKAEVNGLKQEVEHAREASETIKNLNKQLNEAREREEQLKQQMEKLQRENRHVKDRLETLANILCPQMETLKSIYSSDHRAMVELESLCWRKRQG